MSRSQALCVFMCFELVWVLIVAAILNPKPIINKLDEIELFLKWLASFPLWAFGT